FTITGSNAGWIGSILSAGFTNIQNLVGGIGDDTFTFASPGVLTGTIAGGGGINTITGNENGDGFTIAGANAGSIASILINGFSKIQNLTGGSGNDTFVFGGSLAGTISGGGGSNTIIADNNGDAFKISGANAGTINSILTKGFTNIQNLTGGSGNDNFMFADGAGVTGVIDGGTGVNTLNYASYSTGIYANLKTLTSTDTGGIADIQNVTGGQGADILVGDANNNLLIGSKGSSNLIIGGGGS